MRKILIFALASSLLLTAACKGELGGTAVSEGETKQVNNQGNNKVSVNPDVEGVGITGLRRLSREEFDNTLLDLLGDTTRPGGLALPEDAIDPFDNDHSTQRVSRALVEALENVAIDVSTRAMADVSRRDEIIGCTPSGPSDEVCFRSFVKSFGLRALRHPLTDEDVERYMPLLAFGVEDENFYTAAGLVIQAMLQQPKFVYHVERGVPVEGRPNLYRLNQFEVANKLAYFLWGTMPDDLLLEAAEAGALGTSVEVQAQATRMLESPKAVARIQRFHAMWLGYHRLGEDSTISAAMLAESNALIKRIIFDEHTDYMDLFSHGETWVNQELATHYGLDAPADDAGAWVSYGDSGRGGIFSHGTFLSVASKFGDTSPTQRGRLIRERILCQPIGLPSADLNVNVDEEPTSPDSNCKKVRYEAIQENAGCANCHGKIDPVGFGLENYDQNGVYRTTDAGEPECLIDGAGELTGVGQFNGPKELGELLATNATMETCMIRQVYRFAHGRRDTPTDAESLAALGAAFTTSGRKFDELLVQVVAQESFMYRAVAEAAE